MHSVLPARGAASRLFPFLLGLVGVTSLLGLSPGVAQVPPAATGPELVSVNAAGTGSGNGASNTSFRIDSPQRLLSRDGRYAVFTSQATNLVPLPDGNGTGQDVFIRDLQTGMSELVSVNAAGTASGSAVSLAATVSDDGRFVCFQSDASDLAAGVVDNNSLRDVYVRDRQAGVTTLVSVSVTGTSGNHQSQSPAMTPSGRFVAFKSRADNLVPPDTDRNQSFDVYLRDLQLRTTTLISTHTTFPVALGTDEYGDPPISDDGRLVAFSSAEQLVPEDQNFALDVFVRDVSLRSTELVSANAAGTGSGNGHSVAPAMTPDGRFVAFLSRAGNLSPGVNDTNGGDDLYLRDRQARLTRLVTVNAAGTDAGNDLTVGTPTALSRDGRFLAFTSLASDLVAGVRDLPGTHDVFARDMVAGRTELVSVNRFGDAAGNGVSGGREAISDDGRLVTFASVASDLVDNDVNGPQTDLFQRDVLARRTLLVSRNAAGTGSGNRASGTEALAVTRDGSLVFFSSTASDLVANDTNGAVLDVFVAAPGAVPPALTLANCRVSPTSLPAAGGLVTLSVDVTPRSAVESVTATMTRPDNTTAAVPLVRGEGDTYFGTFNAPANSTLAPQAYRVTMAATGAGGARASAECDPFIVAAAADRTPPVLLNCDVLPRSLGSRGGLVALLAGATDDVGVVGVTATFTLAGATTTAPLPFIASNRYQGEYVFPANTTNATRVYTVSMTAADAAGNRHTVPCGTVTVATDADTQPPVVVNCDVLPRSLGNRGGLVALLAGATDNVGVISVTATFTLAGATTTVPLSVVAPTRYQGEYVFPANPTSILQTYTVSMTAADAAGNRHTVPCGAVTVAAGADTEPPALTSCTVAPRAVSHLGGDVGLKVLASDNVGLGSVMATFFLGSATTPVSLLRVVGRGHVGTFHAPPNATSSPVTYTVAVTLVDTAGNRGTFPCGVVTVAADPRIPIVSACLVSPRALPTAGGRVRPEITIRNPERVRAVLVIFKRADGGGKTARLLVVSESRTRFRAGVLLDPNRTLQPQVYAVEFRIYGVTRNVSHPCGTVTAATGPSETTPPVVESCTLTPRALPSTGGQVRIAARVTDPGGSVDRVTATFTHNGVSTAVFLPSFDEAGSDFRGAFAAPSNSTGVRRVYSVSLVAVDSAGNQATAPCGEVTVAADTLPPVLFRCTVDPRTVGDRGGPVAVHAIAGDNAGVASVSATFTLNGTATLVRLLPLPGLGYRSTFNVPRNLTNAVLTYTVTLTLVDTSGNRREASCGTVAVAAFRETLEEMEQRHKREQVDLLVDLRRDIQALPAGPAATARLEQYYRDLSRMIARQRQERWNR